MSLIFQKNNILHSISRIYEDQELTEEDRLNMKNNRRILIVDDEPYNQLALQIILFQCGFPNIKYLIDNAYNGKEAVE